MEILNSILSPFIAILAGIVEIVSALFKGHDPAAPSRGWDGEERHYAEEARLMARRARARANAPTPPKAAVKVIAPKPKPLAKVSFKAPAKVQKAKAS